MDQCIIQNLKNHYRQSVSEQILFLIDVKESYDIILLTAINDLYAMWDTAQPETKEVCVRHAVFIFLSKKYGCKANDENDRSFEEIELPNFSKTLLSKYYIHRVCSS